MFDRRVGERHDGPAREASQYEPNTLVPAGE